MRWSVPSGRCKTNSITELDKSISATFSSNFSSSCSNPDLGPAGSSRLTFWRFFNRKMRLKLIRWLVFGLDSSFLKNISILGQKFRFFASCQKFRFFASCQNFRFLSKKFWSNNFDFCQKFRSLSKRSIFGQKFRVLLDSSFGFTSKSAKYYRKTIVSFLQNNKKIS